MAEGETAPRLVYRVPTGAAWSIRPVHHTLLDAPGGPILRIQEIASLPQGYTVHRPPTVVHTLVIPLRDLSAPCQIDLGGRKVFFRGAAGDCVVMPASADSIWSPRGGDEQTVLASFPVAWLRALAEEHDLPGTDAEPEARIGATLPNSLALAALLRRAHAEKAVTPGLAEHWAVLAALSVLRMPMEEGRGAARGGGLPPARLRRVLEHIEANLDGDVSLVTLGRVAGISTFHFARAFRATVGVPPHAHVTERRIARAQALIRRGGMDLAEIALAAGFAGQSHFTTAFRRATGTTPGQWRRAVGADSARRP